jgi:hypothetical protein
VPDYTPFYTAENKLGCFNILVMEVVAVLGVEVAIVAEVGVVETFELHLRRICQVF